MDSVLFKKKVQFYLLLLEKQRETEFSHLFIHTLKSAADQADPVRSQEAEKSMWISNMDGHKGPTSRDITHCLPKGVLSWICNWKQETRPKLKLRHSNIDADSTANYELPFK